VTGALPLLRRVNGTAMSVPLTTRRRRGIFSARRPVFPQGFAGSPSAAQ
jgi:hypothetical protein